MTSVYRWSRRLFTGGQDVCLQVSRRLVTCDEDVCLHMDHVDGVRPDVQPVGGDVLPVLSHKRGNKAHLQKQKMHVKSAVI
jgi:hypothetical protein